MQQLTQLKEIMSRKGIAVQIKAIEGAISHEYTSISVAARAIE
jgi:hypothetical protein